MSFLQSHVQGIVQWYVLPPDDNMVGLYSLSVEKSVPLFLQTYSVSDEFFNKGLFRDTDCSNCLRRFSAVTARFL